MNDDSDRTNGNTPDERTAIARWLRALADDFPDRERELLKLLSRLVEAGDHLYPPPQPTMRRKNPKDAKP